LSPPAVARESLQKKKAVYPQGTFGEEKKKTGKQNLAGNLGEKSHRFPEGPTPASQQQAVALPTCLRKGKEKERKKETSKTGRKLEMGPPRRPGR